MEPLSVRRMVSARVPTDEAEFQLYLYHNNHDDKEHLAVVLGDVRGKPDVLVRLHSECFTGDVLGSRRCDCGEQLHFAMQQIAAHGEGVLVYLRQEGAALACWISCALTTCKMRAMTPSKLTCSSAIRPMSAITP